MANEGRAGQAGAEKDRAGQVGADRCTVAERRAHQLAGADGGVTVVDVKAPGKRADPEVRAVMEWTRRVAALRGWAFEEWYGAPRLLQSIVIRAVRVLDAGTPAER
jgi:hypothetical protein